MRKSIKRQLLFWLLIPLLSLAVLSTIAAYYLGITLARDIYDKQLVNSADSVAARIKVKDDHLTVDLPPAAQAILRHYYHDEFYFQVISSDGKKISGDHVLPPPPPMVANSEPIFRNIKLGNKELRIVSLPAPTPELDFDHVVIEVAETRHTRNDLAGQITMSILLAQLVLIVSGAVAIWLGVDRGLLPLTNVERAVENRSPGDLRPLEVEEPVEMVSLINALNRLFRQLQDDIQAQRRFTSNAAHQLRTPLAVLGTYCDLARKTVKDAETKDVLVDLEAGIIRMSRLVNGLLALARSEPTAAAKHSFSVVDLNVCASSVSASHVPQALKKKIDLEFLSSSEPVMIFGDLNSLEELVSNLIENSIIYTQAGGSILIKVELRNNQTILTISDDGPGIAVEERSKVFERFYRINGTEPPGTGLGLSIVKEIATSHNASITIEAGAKGKGTSISVSFPPLPVLSPEINSKGQWALT